MTNNLQKQISIYSLDTSSFYNEAEHKLHTEIEELKLELYLIKELLKLDGKAKTKKIDELIKKNKNNPKLIEKVIASVEETITHNKNVARIKDELAIAKKQNKALRTVCTSLRKSLKGKSNDEKESINKLIIACKNEIEFLKVFNTIFNEELKGMISPKKILNDLIELKKNKLKKLLDKNKKVRTLREDSLVIKNAVSVFDSVLTRTLGCNDDEGICTDIIIVQSYYYRVLEDLIVNGFVNADGERWVYLSSSAGQIRKKRGVWIKKLLWEKHENSLMCGLNKDVINSKGGINLTKYQAYKALCSSASVEWKEFSDKLIDKCIVVDDLTITLNNSKVDYINRDTYEIELNTPKDIEIEVTDGCGIVRSSVSDKSFQIRAPHIKGLLVPFPIDDFLNEHPNASATVIDIYGDKHDISNVDIIFTRSQFKMVDYYDSWKEYQDNFKKYNCQAAKLNEEDTSGEATLTYQMLQSLVDVDQEELEQIASLTTIDIENLGRDQNTTLRVMGVIEDNKRMNYFQQALLLYPALLQDEHTKQTIKSKKESLITSAKSGKLRIEGAKYTFLVPDLYAFAQKIFGLEVTGLLEDGEVYCRLYDEGKMCILRSPHLYREWGIRNNRKTELMKKWFITDGIYVGISDNLSKMLQYDNDGDRALTLQSELVTKVAERNMQGILPLYYVMAKAKPETISNENLYKSLVEAYKAKVGLVSNDITKVWNSGKVDTNAMNVIRWLTMESNFQIDRAKTNFMTTRPDYIDELIKSYTKAMTPYFFQYVKNKEEDKVEPINNSTVNRLDGIVNKANKRMYFAKFAGKFDYKQLLKNKRINIENDEAQAIIKKYEELDKNKKWMMNDAAKDELESHDNLPVYKKIRKELLKLNNNAHDVADILVKYLYSDKKRAFKTTLWASFGKEIVWAIKKNVHDIVECKSCHCKIDEPKKNQVRCNKCAKERRKEKDRIRKSGDKNSALMTIV